MNGQIRLGSIFGIEVKLHYSWFVIAALVTISLAGQLMAADAGWSGPAIWAAAIVTALAFFAALLAHEFAHALVARARGTPVPSITLFALGGMARMSREASDARSEFWISIAGPLTSILIGAAALGLALSLGWNYDVAPSSAAMAMLVWFGFINIALALFNLIPGFPLDGGRVLRAAIWGVTGNQLRGTVMAAAIGQAVAVVLIVLGILSAFRGSNFGGLWLAIIGLFLSMAGRVEAAQSMLMERLRGVRVADVMAPAPPSEVPDDPSQLRSQPHVDADAPVSDALEQFERRDLTQLPVLDQGRVRGMISREQILRLIERRARASPQT